MRIFKTKDTETRAWLKLISQIDESMILVEWIDKKTLMKIPGTIPYKRNLNLLEEINLND